MSETPRFTPARLRDLAEVQESGDETFDYEHETAAALRYAADVLEAQQEQQRAFDKAMTQAAREIRSLEKRLNTMVPAGESERTP